MSKAKSQWWAVKLMVGGILPCGALALEKSESVDLNPLSHSIAHCRKVYFMLPTAGRIAGKPEKC